MLELLTGLTMIFGRRAAAESVLDLAGVGSGDRAVDIGCGPGVAVRAAAARGATVVGVDPSSTVLRLARFLTPARRAATVTFRRGTAAALGLADRSASVVWAMASAHHWPDIDAGLVDARRVLEIGGRLVVWERVVSGRGARRRRGFTRRRVDATVEKLRVLGFDRIDVETHRLRGSDFVSIRGTRRV